MIPTSVSDSFNSIKWIVIVQSMHVLTETVLWLKDGKRIIFIPIMYVAWAGQCKYYSRLCTQKNDVTFVLYEIQKFPIKMHYLFNFLYNWLIFLEYNYVTIIFFRNRYYNSEISKCCFYFLICSRLVIHAIIVNERRITKYLHTYIFTEVT